MPQSAAISIFSSSLKSSSDTFLFFETIFERFFLILNLVFLSAFAIFIGFSQAKVYASIDSEAVQGDKVLLRICLLMIVFIRVFAAPEVFQASLGNGLKLMVLPNHRVPQVWVNVWYNVGSKDEVDGHTGLAHILEHMMFHGTAKYPDFNKVIDGCGGVSNARTSFDYTNYYEIVPKSCLSKMLDIEADRMQNLIFDDKKIALELQAVREERLRSEQSQEFLAYEQALAALHVRGPYHHLPIGWMSDIENTKISDIKDWYKSWYLPNNAVVVVGGDVDTKEVLHLVNKYFTGIAPKVLPARNIRQDVPLRGNTHLTVKSKSFTADSTSFLYLVPSLVSAKDKTEPYAIYVMAAMLASGDSSILNKALVQSGKALFVDVSYSILRRYNSGLSLSISTNKLLPKQNLLQILQKVAQGGFTAKDLARAKTMVLADYVFSQDDFSDVLSKYSSYEISGATLAEHAKFKQRIEAVTAKDIQKVLKKYLIDQKFVQLDLVRS